MVTITGSVIVPKAPDVVFDYVTNPTTWPAWYPITEAVDVVAGTTDRPDAPARRGERIREHVRSLGMSYVFDWTFLESRRPEFLHYEGHAEKWGGHATVTYRFLPTEQDGQPATRFVRVLEYRQTNWLMKFLDVLLLRWIARRASDRALQNLRTRFSS